MFRGNLRRSRTSRTMQKPIKTIGFSMIFVYREKTVPRRRSRANWMPSGRPKRHSRANLTAPGCPKRRSRANLMPSGFQNGASRPSKRSIQLKQTKTSAIATQLQCLDSVRLHKTIPKVLQMLPNCNANKMPLSMDIDGSILVHIYIYTCIHISKRKLA